MGGYGDGKLPGVGLPGESGVGLLKFVSLIVTAAGTGRRFGTGLDGKPKQFANLGGISVIQRTVSVFRQFDDILEFIVVVPEKYINEANAIFHDGIKIVAGSHNRQASVYAALKTVDANADIVLVHDGVRPFVNPSVIWSVINYAGDGYGAVAGIKTTDTVKHADAQGWVVSTPDREMIWSVQTPQGFPYRILMEAHDRAAREGYTGTDDSMLVERYGLARIKMIESDARNIKITTPEDILYGEALLHIEDDNGIR
jgi:2-C-methyl-D-erythritol 4-phosphate cytidylyltransferase